ncbi:ring-infected erythrocyte surface antigen-like [Pieris brassicae]|uniref:DUF4794 domain-containing protein n=1 Tax=Pieris brassicae TaxID=7116 RepID=A0A9P0TU59_PIEBR|nr:ring-infected erythrocyte surface antigen-like [Pieris brassicae]CAH4037570.1 unnamed protein product [Pieris brassicae]
MKVLALLCLALGSVTARGSGPYLPSGWRPDGPAFYLPSKQASTDPLKDLILHGSEASGSDSLREYGPPKLSQEVIKQNLPNENIDLTFTSAEKLQPETLNGSVDSGTDASLEFGSPKLQESQDLIATELPQEVTEQVFVDKSSYVTEASTITAQEESVIEPQVVETTTVLAEVPILIIQDNAESTLAASFVENGDGTVNETPLPVEVTSTSDVQNSVEADVNTDDSATNETKDNLVEPIESLNSLTAVKAELEQTVQQIVQNFEKSIEKVSENIVQNDRKVEESGVKIEQTEQNAEEKQVIEQNIQNFSENTQNAEHIEQAEEKTEENEQKTLEQVVQNIPEVLTYVNNDITQQVEKTESQNVESSYPEFSESLEQAPEGFLEYGPPGFKEYGPPKEDELSTATAEELHSEAESFESTNETRRRRFSPKFKPTKSH